ncbi:MAG: hypothetical protein ACRC0L_03340, partial [Angustibacter sp.]
MSQLPDGRVVVRVAPPDTRPAAAITGHCRTRGERVVWCRDDGWLFDLRATSNPYRRDDDRLVVDLVTESAWYAWQLNGTRANSLAVLASTLFL